MVTFKVFSSETSTVKKNGTTYLCTNILNECVCVCVCVSVYVCVYVCVMDDILQVGVYINTIVSIKKKTREKIHTICTTR